MYDPLKQAYPEANQAYPASYWASTVSDVSSTNPLTDDIHVDVAIIGGGYTGLSSAIHLRQNSDKRVAVLEANQAGWGCSGRNGGFVLAGTGRLSIQAMQKKWGEQTTKAIYQEYQDAIATVDGLIEQGKINCDKIQGGYLKLAHKASLTDSLKIQADYLQSDFAESVQFVSASDVDCEYIRTNCTHGGLYYPNCFAINPLKLAQGYNDMALASGTEIYTNSPVTEFSSVNGIHQLRTAGGGVTAEQVIIASNAYSGTSTHTLVNKRHFPVLSSIITTRPLDSSELAAINMRAGLMSMDTRDLKYYYRLLPDNRLLFGGRGAITGKEANHPLYKQRLEEGLASTFAPLAGIQIDNFWSGWISVSLDDYPRIWHSEDKSIHYAMGYCGSGVAFASQAGKRLAQQVLEIERPDLPFWQSGLKTFPFASMRRIGLRAFYLWANWVN